MIRRIAAFIALFALGSVDVNAATRAYPSLAKRPVETRDGNAPAPAVVQAAPADAALVKQVETLGIQASTADTAFKTEFGKARGLVAAADGAAPTSEAWVAAQMSISNSDAARYDSVAALASLDTLYVGRQDNPDVNRVAADMATIDPVRTRVLAIVDTQNDALDSLRRALRTP
ncbi:MAG: hypothetical protein J7498_13995 [Sphingobium sp.]|nr:hypothetical protein [Sphingobium sp.]